jgi:hypothetical protein
MIHGNDDIKVAATGAEEQSVGRQRALHVLRDPGCEPRLGRMVDGVHRDYGLNKARCFA